MKTAKPYVAAEPVNVSGYQDSRGRIHKTREAALEANFQHDLTEACRAMDHQRMTCAWDFVHMLKQFAKTNPDMLRILLGDREYT